MMIPPSLSEDARSVKARNNVIVSLLIRLVDGLTYLTIVPLALGYLDSYKYGIWITLNSILVWIDSFDIGLGNGLRNKLAEAEAEGDKKKAREYVSTTFFLLIGLMLLILIIGVILFKTFDWYSLMGVNKELISNLTEVIFASFLFICLTFIFKFIGNVYLAKQLPMASNALTTTGHLLSLVIIFILSKFTQGDLFLAALAYSVSPLIVYLIAYPLTFEVFYKYLNPSLHYFRISMIKPLFSIGVLFFLLQVAGIILFSLSNIMISKSFGPDQVSPYNVSFRYFSIVTMLMGIISAPMWSATTDAYVSGEIDWIRKSVRRINIIILIMAVILIVMTAFSKLVFKLWVGDALVVPNDMSCLMAFYTFILMWSSSYSNFLNGMGKLKIQVVTTIVEAVLFIILCPCLGKHIGINGIILGLILVNSLGAVLNTIQVHGILK